MCYNSPVKVLKGGFNLNNPIYLDSYTLQSDSRIRLPKSAIENLGATPGKTRFNVFYSPDDKSLILKISDINGKEASSENE